MTVHGRSRNLFELIGSCVIGVFVYMGGMFLLGVDAAKWTIKGASPSRGGFRWSALSAQMVRVGFKSLSIVVLIQTFLGVILALQLAPTLSDYGQVDKVATIIGIGGFRMIGPIITAVVLSGFAGASIAAELGTMVVSEEIEAMEAMAMNPVRFLVVPRVIATLISMILLTVIADLLICVGGYITCRLALGPEAYLTYWNNISSAVRVRDMATGLVQSGVFGILIGLIACHEGLKVRGGAEGVGRATTMTVVFSLVATVLAACIFTVAFFLFNI